MGVLKNMGRMTFLFVAIFVASLIGYLTVWGLVMSNPANAIWLSILMFPLGIGILVGVVGAVVCFILHK